jgi:tRNA/tmRNA/rRNA uracil-C5-methylase (TrmA/RlmC/RlmD family)
LRPQYHKELVLRIESLTNLGFGIARVELDEDVDEGAVAREDGEGGGRAEEGPRKWVVFCPNVIPGELVRVRIYRNFASYSDADLLQIIEPSADRVEPACSLATVCGGCQYQHITIERQRKMKTLQVQELFERLGGLSPTEFPRVLDTIGTGEVFGYRSKITPHYDAPKRANKRAQDDGDTTTTGNACEIGPIGFKEKASHRLVDVPYCHIATPKINDALDRLREEKREEARRGLLKKPTKGATLLLRDSNGVVETNHTAYVNTTVKDLVFRFQAGNFFQNNPFMLDLMVDLVVDAATKASPGGKTMTHLIDCYCGSGLFCIGSSSSFDVCVGIEVNEMAISEARENAALNGIRNCDFVAASAEAIFSSEVPVGAGAFEGGEDDDESRGLLVGDFPRDSTVVVVDPPRKGCSEEFLHQLNEYRPARVVYMSCDPATQARDAKFLLSFGYRIVSIQPFDLFPQTRHIECLAIFERKDQEVN